MSLLSWDMTNGIQSQTSFFAENTRMKDVYKTLRTHDQNFINTGKILSKMEEGVKELHQTLVSMNQNIEYLLKKANDTRDGSDGERAEGSRARQEAYTPPHPRNMGNQQGITSITYKMKFPEFNGVNPLNWIREANRFFELNPNENRKVLHAGYYMVGVANTWYTEYIEGKGRLDIDWECFCVKLLHHFTNRSEKKNAIKNSGNLTGGISTSHPDDRATSKVVRNKPSGNCYDFGRVPSPGIGLAIHSSTWGKLQILKPMREKNGTTLFVNDNILKPTNGGSESVTTPSNLVPERKPVLTVLKKRPTSQAKSRNDFFNLLRKKSIPNTSSAIENSSAIFESSVLGGTDGAVVVTDEKEVNGKEFDDSENLVTPVIEGKIGSGTMIIEESAIKDGGPENNNANSASPEHLNDLVEASIGEEVAAKKLTLKNVTDHIADVVSKRAKLGYNYGVILIPERLIDFIPEVQQLIAELNEILAHKIVDEAGGSYQNSGIYALVEMFGELGLFEMARHVIKTTQSKESPIMSTYLMAVVIGLLDYVEDHSPDRILVRVYCQVGKTSQVKFALDVVVKTLGLYKEYLEVPYSLPKLGMITISDLAAGAMEKSVKWRLRKAGDLGEKNWDPGICVTVLVALTTTTNFLSQQSKGVIERILLVIDEHDRGDKTGYDESAMRRENFIMFMITLVCQKFIQDQVVAATTVWKSCPFPKKNEVRNLHYSLEVYDLSVQGRKLLAVLCFRIWDPGGEHFLGKNQQMVIPGKTQP